MKRYLIIIIAIIFCQNIIGQNYYPFPTDTARWDCLFWHQWSPSDIHLSNTQYLLQGDTIIQGIDYKKIYYDESDNSTFDNVYIGALREDSLKNIYFFPDNETLPTPGPITFPSDTTEYLIYTFNNLDIGTILPIDNNSEMTVIGIDSVLIGNYYRKQYQIQSDNFDTDYWIEGIGSINELFSSFTYIFEWQYYTLCFTDSLTYFINSPNEEDSCHYWIPLGLNELERNQLTVYPNPTKDYITIKTENKSGIVIIYNSKGQKINEITRVDSKTKINVKDLISGLYFIEFINNNEKKYTKLIKK